MTNPDLTLIGVLVDRSGSMATCKNDMEGGLNTFLREQAALPGLLDVTLAQFDSVYESVWEPTRLNGGWVPEYALFPRNMTALLDGMGKFITETGEYLASQSEDKRPGKVVIMVVTDGMENASREWKRSQVKALVEQQTNVYNWEFTFLGANMDAIAEGTSLGVAGASSLIYDTSNTLGTFAMASASVGDYRSGVTSNVTYSDEDRQDAVKKS